jgi:hypothetical protein
MSEVQTIPISTRALLARIGRKLVHDGEYIRAMSPSSRWYAQYGPYYVVNANNAVTTAGISDLGKLAREVGVLKPFERWEAARKAGERHG